MLTFCGKSKNVSLHKWNCFAPNVSVVCATGCTNVCMWSAYKTHFNLIARWWFSSNTTCDSYQISYATYTRSATQKQKNHRPRTKHSTDLPTSYDTISLCAIRATTNEMWKQMENIIFCCYDYNSVRTCNNGFANGDCQLFDITTIERYYSDFYIARKAICINWRVCV